MYKIVVSKDGEVFLETNPIIPEQIPGFLSIIDNPRMYGSPDFEITIKRMGGKP